MTDQVKKFYEKKYSKEGRDFRPKGLMGFLFLKLRKHEETRTHAIKDLIENGKKLLDVGCGGGEIISYCKERNMFDEYRGIDVSSRALKLAKNNIKQSTKDLKKVFLGRLNINNKLPYRKNSFNTITCIAVLEHIFDPYFVMEEISRVLVSGGILIVEVPNLVWIPRRLAVLFGRLPVTAETEGWDGGHLHYFTFNATRLLLEEFDFEIEYQGSSGIFSGIRNLWPELLGGNIIIKARKK